MIKIEENALGKCIRVGRSELWVWYRPYWGFQRQPKEWRIDFHTGGPFAIVAPMFLFIPWTN